MDMLMGRVHPGVRCSHAAFAHRLERQAAGKAEARDRLLNKTGIDARVDQGAQRHVAGDPAEAIEIGDAHSRTPCTGNHNGEFDAILTDPGSATRPNGEYVTTVGARQLLRPTADAFRRQSENLGSTRSFGQTGIDGGADSLRESGHEPRLPLSKAESFPAVRVVLTRPSRESMEKKTPTVSIYLNTENMWTVRSVWPVRGNLSTR